MLRKTILLIALFLSVNSLSFCATYWLATDGSDSNPGTEEQPFKSWKYAISKLVADGDELIIKPGLYSKGVQGAMMPVRPAYNDWVTIRAQVPGTVKIWYGSQYVLLPVRPYTRVSGIWFSGGYGIRWADNAGPKHHLIVEDCEFKSTEESIAYIGRRMGRPLDLAGGSDITIRRCLFQECIVSACIGTGVDLVENLLVEDCKFIHNWSETNSNVDGLLIDVPREPENGNTYTKDYNIVIRNCYSSGHGDAGFDIKPVSTIQNCVAEGNTYTGFKLWAIGTKLQNCLSKNNTDSGASMANNGQIADQCTFIGNGKYAVRPQAYEGQKITRSIIVGPMHNANADQASVVVSNSIFWVPGDDPNRWAVTMKHTSYSQLVWTWAEILAGGCPAIGENVVLAPPNMTSIPTDWGYADARPVPEPPTNPPEIGELTITISQDEINAFDIIEQLIQRIKELQAGNR